MLRVEIFNRELSRSEKINQLYDFYQSQWISRFEKMNLNKGNLADTFQNFDKKVGLFLNEKPIGFFGSRLFDLRLTHQRHQDYLNQFKVDLLDQLEKSSMSLFNSIEYLCIHPMFRQRNNKNYALILMNFSVQYLIQQPTDGMLAVASIEYGVSHFCRQIGATPILEKVPFGPETVDIMGFKPKEVVQFNDLSVVRETNRLLNQTTTNRIPMMKVA